MKVVHIATAFPRHEEDPITPWLVELVRRQRASGIDAGVLVPAYRGGPVVEPIPEVPIRRFRYAPPALETLTHDESVPERIRRQRSAAALVPLYLAGGIRGAHDAGRDNPDVVHVHWPMPHALFGAAARWGSGGRSAVVCSYYSVELNWVEQRLKPLRPFLTWTARMADAVTAISTSTQAAVQRLTDKPVSVVAYGAAFDDDGMQPAMPAMSGGGPLKILFVGRLVERKGVEVLVRALAESTTVAGAELTVIGAGDRRDVIERTARLHGVADRVSFKGSVSRDELVKCYQSHDLFVLPAVVDSKGDTEGLGVVLLEALRFERPVIASNAGGIPDIIEHGRSGLLVPPGSSVALASAIEELAADPDRARQLAAQGRRISRERFGWAKILADTGQVYASAMETRHGA
jgi:glycosyltransferase involved in cell wall biosynthesis